MVLIKRELQQVIRRSMFCGKAIILIGARQVGKSTLFRQILSDESLPVKSDKILCLNCDDPEIRTLLANANYSKLRLLISDNRILFIDEAQRVPGIGLTLKMITDNFPDVQLLVTGSSSFTLQGDLNEPLTGRKFEYQLFPLSTGELYTAGGLTQVNQSLEIRLLYGSYPDVLNNSISPREILMNLSGSYLYQDLLSVEGVRRPALLERLLVAVALQIGSEVSYNELAQTVGSDSKTVEKYVDLLEKCYIIFRLPSLCRNVRTELKRSRKIYFYDNGIRNAILNNLNQLAVRQDVGALWENFFISERKKFNLYRGRYVKSYFWRTTQQQEIDYIEESDGEFSAFEVKWNPRKTSISLPASFISAYPIVQKAVVTPENYTEYLL